MPLRVPPPAQLPHDVEALTVLTVTPLVKLRTAAATVGAAVQEQFGVFFFVVVVVPSRSGLGRGAAMAGLAVLAELGEEVLRAVALILMTAVETGGAWIVAAGHHELLPRRRLRSRHFPEVPRHSLGPVMSVPVEPSALALRGLLAVVAPHALT